MLEARNFQRRESWHYPLPIHAHVWNSKSIRVGKVIKNPKGGISTLPMHMYEIQINQSWESNQLPGLNRGCWKPGNPKGGNPGNEVGGCHPFSEGKSPVGWLVGVFLAAAAAAIAAKPAARNGGWCWPKSGLGWTNVGLKTSLWLSLIDSSSSSCSSSRSSSIYIT